MSDLSFIYQRSQWGARYRAGFGDRSRNYPLRETWIHHSVTAHLGPNATVAQEAAQMRVLEDIGQQRFGGGISYTFVVFPSGRVYMGTGASRIGAHTGGRNSISLSICFAGNYSTTQATSQALNGAARLIRGLQSAGVLAQARANGGHRDAPGQSTACPGNALHRQISTINSRAASGNTGTTTTANTPLEGTVMTTPAQLWGHRGLDYVNSDASTKNNQLARAHQYAQQAARGTFRSAPLAALRNRWQGIREDGFLARTWLQYSYFQARAGREESRDRDAVIEAKIDALATALDEALDNQGKIKAAIENIDVEYVKANAAEVAARLEITVTDDEEE